MTPERWRQIKRIFQAAFELPTGGRRAYAQQACAGDADLLAEVESLLDSVGAEEFLSGPAAAYVPEAWADEAWDRNIGRRIGAYRIVRLIGEGGMGAVYLAERAGEFQQQAALKLLRAGMDSRGFVARFRHERQILASLDHPNIARLLEGGATDEGRPYFVMEYVEGEPIDVYAAKHELGIDQRLRLFSQVCAAVQYAHQNLVVHRDIKPGNILVTGPSGHPGTPKLLDFGIAKLLRSGGPRETEGLTQAGGRLMTPEYASPEQVRGEPIGTATDVYSLGAVLYQLLAGKTPHHFPTGSAVEMERAICETDPPPPSQVAGSPAARQLRGDLDTIVLKALQKDPRRRYASAEQIGADIQRHLDGLPIQARPQTLAYRAGRFVRRNRVSVAAAALVAISLAAGMAAAVWQAHIAQAQRLRAEKRFNDVRQLAHTFLFDFHDAIRDLPGATPARHMVVDKALEYLNGLSQEAAGDAALERELVEAYLRVGDVEGGTGVPNLGDKPGALRSYERALAIAGREARRDPRALDWQRYLARAHMSIGDILAPDNRLAAAVPHYREAVRIYQTIAPRIAGDVAAQFEMASAYESLGDSSGNPGLANLGDAQGAISAYEKVQSIEEGITAAHPGNLRSRRAVGVMDWKIGDVEMGLGKLDEGLRRYQSAERALEAGVARDPLNPTTRLFLALATGKVGSALEAAGQTQAALAQYRTASQIQRGLMEADPQNAMSRNSYALSLQTQAGLLAKTGGRAGALALYREALGIFQQLLALDPHSSRRKERCDEVLAAIRDLSRAPATAGPTAP
jgi:non-specific serine/threonine protein kinase/serine/threonine-protein kinase